MDDSTAVAPSIKGTWFLALAALAYEKIANRRSEQEGAAEGDAIDDDEGTEDASGSASEAPASGTSTPKETASVNGASGVNAKGGRVQATTMAGGRRRKTVRKK